jgi:NHL repeat
MKRQALTLLLVSCLGIAGAARTRADSFIFSTIAGIALKTGTNDGSNASARFLMPGALAAAPGGVLYLADGDKVRSLARVATNWVVNTLPTSLPFVSGVSRTLWGIALDTAGVLYIPGSMNQNIWQIIPSGANWTVSSIAGLPGTEGAKDGTNSAARFSNPSSIAVDSSGCLYIADTDNHAIRTLTHAGTNWVVKTLAGWLGLPGVTDGTNRTASFTSPGGIALDASRNIYVADTQNHTIRKITQIGTNWVTTTIAGLARTPGADDGANSAARFHAPSSIAVDVNGDLYVADTLNDAIRKLTLTGTNFVVSTVGGLPGSFGSADGLATNARFYRPYGIALDASGNVLVADTMNGTIRLGEPAFALQCVLVGGQPFLSWPAAASNYVLETTTTLSTSDAWLPVTVPAYASGDRFVLTDLPQSHSAFFRLRRR